MYVFVDPDRGVGAILNSTEYTTDGWPRYARPVLAYGMFFGDG